MKNITVCNGSNCRDRDSCERFSQFKELRNTETSDTKKKSYWSWIKNGKLPNEEYKECKLMLKRVALSEK